jgi:hypothetical protein
MATKGAMTERLLHALLGATIYLGPFVLIGWVTRRILDWKMRGAHLTDVHEVSGSGWKRGRFVNITWRRMG